MDKGNESTANKPRIQSSDQKNDTIVKTPADLYLEYQAIKGWNRKIQGKFDDTTPYRERLIRELDMFSTAKISDYFLILQGVMNYCYENNIPVGPGRGSAAGCLISWLIDITMIDPIEHGLLLERFYNPGRIATGKLPDIDVDVSKRYRDKIIKQYIIEKYGTENVVPIIAFGKMKPRALIKDIGRVLSVPISDTEAMSRLIDVKRGIPMGIADTLNEVNDKGVLTFAATSLAKYKEQYPELFKWVEDLEDQDMVRTRSVHAAGVIITPEPVGNLIPSEWNASKKVACTGYDMYDLESETGLLKLDLLGLRNTDVLQNTMERLGMHGKYRDILEAIPMDDSMIFRRLSAGQSKGVFQFESHFMRSIMIDVKPVGLEDLSCINALGRPGPLDAKIDVTDAMKLQPNGNLPEFLNKKIPRGWKQGDKAELNMIDVYAARKRGEIKVEYLHPMLEGILGNTLGVMVYQEQVMRIAQVCAGYTLEEADILRDIVGKKKIDKMPAQEEKMLKGMEANGIDRETSIKIWHQIKTFAGYGFNKSHSMSYSVLAYYTAWFKFHHPAEFMASLISSDDDMDKKRLWLQDARDTLGLTVEPPDINLSGKDFTSCEDRIMFGLNDIKGLGSRAVKSLMKTRSQKPFVDIQDFYKRVDMTTIDSGIMKAIIGSGAFLRWGFNKPTLLEWDQIIRDRKAKSKGKLERRLIKQNKLEHMIATHDISKMPKKWKDNDTGYMDSLRAKLIVVKSNVAELDGTDHWFKDLEFMEDMPLAQSLQMEESVLGCTVSGTLASPYENVIRYHGHDSTVDCKDTETQVDKFIVCGVFDQVREHVIKNGNNKGKTMLFAKFIDLDGVVDIMVFPGLLDKHKNFIENGKLAQVVLRRMDAESFMVSELIDVSQYYKGAS